MLSRTAVIILDEYVEKKIHAREHGLRAWLSVVLPLL